MSGFSFRPEAKITFMRYVSFFSRSHDGKRKKRIRFYKSTKKEDLVYLANKFLFAIKLLFFCRIL